MICVHAEQMHAKTAVKDVYGLATESKAASKAKGQLLQSFAVRHTGVRA